MTLKLLIELNSFAEAQVVRSYLASEGFNPILTDEQTRTIAPHLEYFLGRIRIMVPEVEYNSAIAKLREKRVQGVELKYSPLAKNSSPGAAEQSSDPHIKGDLLKDPRLFNWTDSDSVDSEDHYLKKLYKRLKTLLILSFVILPVLPNLYSLYLIYVNQEFMSDHKKRMWIYISLNIFVATFMILSLTKMNQKIHEMVDTVNQISEFN